MSPIVSRRLPPAASLSPLARSILPALLTVGVEPVFAFWVQGKELQNLPALTLRARLVSEYRVGHSDTSSTSADTPRSEMTDAHGAEKIGSVPAPLRTRASLPFATRVRSQSRSRVSLGFLPSVRGQ